MSYPSVDQLAIEIRTGRGVAVLLEGDDPTHDPYVYGEWFGTLGQSITFHPQDGWPRVVAAVQELRGKCPGTKIYGILDRDFVNDASVFRPEAPMVPTDGVVRTSLYTLENYLLDADNWAKTFADIFRRSSAGGWESAGFVQTEIDASYRRYVPVAAYNYVMRYASDTYPAFREHGYRKHPGALGQTPEVTLRALGAGLPEDLGTLYLAKRQEYEQLPVVNLSTVVSGKLVLRDLHTRFPMRPGAGRYDLGLYVNYYLKLCSEPPADLRLLVEAILADAGR